MCLSVHLFLATQFKTENDLILICPYLKYFMDFNKKTKDFARDNKMRVLVQFTTFRPVLWCANVVDVN